MAQVLDTPRNGINGGGDEKKPAIVEVLAPTDDNTLPGAEEVEDDEEWGYPYPTDFKISERPIDDIRHLKVGTCAVQRLPLTNEDHRSQ